MTPAIELLRHLGIPHDVLSYSHDSAALSYGTEAAEALGLDPSSVFKTLVVDVVSTGLAVAIVPVNRQLNLKAVARALGGKKATMAEPDAAERATGYVVGGISPLGQRKLLPTVLDDSADNIDVLFVSGGRRGLEISLAPDDLVATLKAIKASIAP